MEDYKFLWYIIAAVIYFLTRAKKKKSSPKQARPGTENNPAEPPKTFEDLLREITGEESPVEEREVIESKQNEPIVEREETKEETRLEGKRRAFADEESRRVYEESIKRAEGFKLDYEPAEQFKEPKLFKGNGEEDEEDQFSLADEIREGLQADEAKKAIIYSEILNRKY